MAALAVAVALPGWSQGAGRDPVAACRVPNAATGLRASPDGCCKVVREIDDPDTGDRWMLMRDPVHPEGPGRLVLAGGPGVDRAGASRQQRPVASAAGQAPGRPVIHAGDELIVEEHTPVVETRLEAVALGPAEEGARFRARLKIGGKVVDAVAVSAGRAALWPGYEAQP
jgi:hypothetical protein